MITRNKATIRQLKKELIKKGREIKKLQYYLDCEDQNRKEIRDIIIKKNHKIREYETKQADYADARRYRDILENMPEGKPMVIIHRTPENTAFVEDIIKKNIVICVGNIVIPIRKKYNKYTNPKIIPSDEVKEDIRNMYLSGKSLESIMIKHGLSWKEAHDYTCIYDFMFEKTSDRPSHLKNPCTGVTKTDIYP